VRHALLGVVGLWVAGNAVACNAIFDIHDPAALGAAGSGGSGGARPGDMSNGGRGGSGGASGSGGREGDGGTGEPPDGGTGGSPVAPTITLSGTVRKFESPQQFQGGAQVTAFVAPPRPTTRSSLDTGTFSLMASVPDSTLNLEVQYPDSAPMNVPLALLQTRIRLPIGAGVTKVIDPPLVGYDWLGTTVEACGAVADPSTPLSVYFAQRATLLVRISDAGGGVAGIDRGQLQVTLTNGGASRLNQHGLRYDTPQIQDTNPTFVCVLEAPPGGDAGAGEQLVGGTQSQTTELGTFVVFRAQNAQSTGSGEVEVSVPGYAPRSLSLRQSGQIGVLLLGTDW